MIESCNITEWVESAPDKGQRKFREAVHTILTAIANTPHLSADMIMKGGILLAVRYNSARYTTDIDFSTSKTLNEFDSDELQNELEKSLINCSEKLEYELDCRVQRFEVKPRHLEKPTFPSFNIRIGYAYRGSNEHKLLINKKSSTVIDIDYSLNEPMLNIDTISIGVNNNLRVYALVDVIAEKIRAILQQVYRHRQRGQDIYDLFILIEKFPNLIADEGKKILSSLRIKSDARSLPIEKNSLRDDKIREFARVRYEQLTDEIEGELPDFNEAYKTVLKFYECLPW